MLQKAEMKHPLSPGHLNEFWVLVNSQQSCKSLQGVRLLRQLSHELLLKRLISHSDGYNSDTRRAGGGNELKSDRLDQVKLFFGRQSRSQSVCGNHQLQTRATMCRQVLLALSQRPARLCFATRYKVTNTNKLVRSEAKPVCGTASEVRSVQNMVPPAGAVTQGPADQRAAAEDAKWGIGSILRMLAVFWLIKQFFGGSSKSTPSNAVRTDYYWPKFNKSESVDFFLFGSDSTSFSDVSDASKLIWTETHVPLAASSDLSTEYLYRPSKVLCLHP